MLIGIKRTKVMEFMHYFSMKEWIHLSRLLFSFLFVILVQSSPPREAISCSLNSLNCEISNTYGAFPDRSICKAGEVIYPETEEELVSVVAKASMERRKIKVATRFYHSVPKLSCPGNDNGLVIGTKLLNKIVKIDSSAMTITVEPGVTLKELIETAEVAGLAIPNTPYWWGLTIAGLLSTGAHGSSLWGKGSSVHDYVESFRIVTPVDDGAIVRTIDRNHSDLNAVKVSLGVLGVISQITLTLEPMFKRSITNVMDDDKDLAERVERFGFEHEFGDITWYPSLRKAVYRVDDRVDPNSPGNGHLDYYGLKSLPSSNLTAMRKTEESQEIRKDAKGKCVTAKLATKLAETLSFGFTNNGVLFTGYPVIGFQSHLQASGQCFVSPPDGLATACSWDPRIKGAFFYQTGISIALTKVKSFIQDLEKLRDLLPDSMCGIELYSGILMRYIKASPAYLGKEEDCVDFDISYYRSRDPTKPRLYEDVFDEMEQIAIFKYGGLPHWGKNRNVAFHDVIKKYSKAHEFLKVKESYDPYGLFSNEWTDQILGLTDGLNIVKEGCALEGICICSDDIHCAPREGYFCRPGKVYAEARVCTSIV